LRSINGKIYIPLLTTINKICVQDKPIMNENLIRTFTKSQLEAINACRIFLQVTTLAEISNDVGTHILISATIGTCNEQGIPTIHLHSTSTILWPHQTRPPQKAWYLWKMFLKQYTTNTPTMKLVTPLGPWLSICHEQRTWKYKQIGDDLIDTLSIPHKYYTLSRRRIYYTYTLQEQYQTVMPQAQHPVIPLNKYFDTIVCNAPTDAPMQQNIPQSEICDDIPIYTSGFIHDNINLYTKIIVASDGSLNNNQSTFGGLVATDHTTMIEINGATPTQHDPTSLTAEAYGCFYILRHLINNLDKTFYKNNILILLDSTTLINRITTAKLYTPTPTQCLSPEHDTIHSITELLKVLPNVQLKHIKAHQPDKTSYTNSPLSSYPSQTNCMFTQPTSHTYNKQLQDISKLH
jgi:hypothetical protein